MAELAIPYGRTQLSFRLPPGASVTVLKPASVPAAPDQAAEVARALDEAISKHPLRGGEAVVVVSDSTRPVPNSTILPLLLRRMEAAGISPDRTTLLIATGLHRPARESEIPALLGDEIPRRYKVVSHDARRPETLVQMGATSRGTPIWINRLYVESDVRVLTGMIEPHQFVGFTGGAKSVSIGLAGEGTIEGNHALLRDPRSRMGVYDGNPARAEMEEILDRIGGADLAVNVILNNEKQIVAALAGLPRDVQRAGVHLSARMCQVAAPHLFDLVIASPGGHPKDLEVYQAQKAVAHAAIAVREGGTIILVAECPEGAGDARFEETMAAASSPEEVIERFGREGFRMGAHKAFLLARSMVRARVILVSDRLPRELGRRLLFEQHSDMASALASAFERHGTSLSVAVMPKASSTVPRVEATGTSDERSH